MRTGPGPRRRPGAAVRATALLGALALLPAVAPQQAAADGRSGAARAVASTEGAYRYWSFWTRDADGTWAYASQGPASLRPADGRVVGFRFSVSEDRADGTTPRGPADFAAVCADTPEAAGRKRLALVIDPGTAADAPPGESPVRRPRTVCVSVAADASAAEALATTAPPLRYNSAGLLCAIDGYPGSGCGEPLSDSSGSDPAGDGGRTLPLVAGVLAVAVLAGGALWQVRRRRS